MDMVRSGANAGYLSMPVRATNLNNSMSRAGCTCSLCWIGCLNFYAGLSSLTIVFLPTVSKGVNSLINKSSNTRRRGRVVRAKYSW